MTEQRAVVSGSGQSIQAGRDVHIHHGSGTRRVATPAMRGECPYPGLAAFTTEQANWFFGRDRLTAHLVGRVADRLAQGRPVLVVGPSGAGKSSLLRAGLLAAIGRRGALPVTGSVDWPQVVLTPTARPMAALTATFPGDPPDRAVVVVDQLEELFTLCNDEAERHQFLDVLADLAGHAAVVFGLRIDAYPHCLDHPVLREAAQCGQVVIGAMTETEIREAVVHPAHEAGLDLEPGLVDVLLRDLDVTEEGYEAGRLPLLAHALRALWGERHGHLLTIAGYHTTGGICDAVRTTAEDTYTGLSEPDRAAARTVFPRLVRLGDEPGCAARRPVPCAELPVGGVVDAFVAARLLTRDREHVTITHEVLLRAWPRLRAWLADDRVAHLTRQQLEDAATAWIGDGRNPAMLFRGNRLHSISAGGLSPTGTAFYRASLRQETKARRRRRALIAILAALALVASLAAAMARSQQQAAQRSLRQVVATNLLNQARKLRDDGSHDLAAQLSLVAWRLRQETGTKDAALYTALISHASVEFPVGTELLADRRSPVVKPVFSPDEHTLALAVSGLHGGGFVQLWDITDWTRARPVTVLVHREARATAVEFSPDGRLLAASFSDGTVQLWRTHSRESPGLAGKIDDRGGPLDHRDQLAGFLDNRTVVVGHHATDEHLADVSTATLWDVSDPARARRLGPALTYHGDNTGLVAVNAHEHVVVTSSSPYGGAGAEPRTLVWNVTNPARPSVATVFGFTAQEGRLWLHPDGNTLTTTSEDGNRFDLWSRAAPARPERRVELPAIINPSFVDATYSPDGNMMAITYSLFYDLFLWDVTKPSAPRPIGDGIIGSRYYIKSKAFSVDGSMIATGASDTHAVNDTGEPGAAVFRLWNLDTSANVRRLCATTPEITEQQWKQYVPNLDYAPPCS
jgi:WD40 repeat protein/energy-coupling factor transporter ATP-binding protein EcfA2